MYAIVFHAHQKLDRAAHEALEHLRPPGSFFPAIENIVHFEGKNGPDSSKLKKGIETEQPWHFVDPAKDNDEFIASEIETHYNMLVQSLKKKDEIRSAFEAAWLAHALVDGLTPAHHYPYEEALESIQGLSKEERKGLIGRAYAKGDTITESLAKSMKLVGPKGVITTHATFEAGAYLITAPLKLSKYFPSPDEVEDLAKKGIGKVFKQYLDDVARLNLFERYIITGWTNVLREDFKEVVLPKMIKIVTIAWYSAIAEAEA
jgi:hypothetical protein